MSKRTIAQIRKIILQTLSDGKEYSYGALERKVDTNWQTIRDHIKELQLFEAVTMENDKIKITTLGRNVLRRIKE